jgi:hypothetical protein
MCHPLGGAPAVAPRWGARGAGRARSQAGAERWGGPPSGGGAPASRAPCPRPRSGRGGPRPRPRVDEAHSGTSARRTPFTIKLRNCAIPPEFWKRKKDPDEMRPVPRRLGPRMLACPPLRGGPANLLLVGTPAPPRINADFLKISGVPQMSLALPGPPGTSVRPSGQGHRLYPHMLNYCLAQRGSKPPALHFHSPPPPRWRRCRHRHRQQHFIALRSRPRGPRPRHRGAPLGPGTGPRPLGGWLAHVVGTTWIWPQGHLTEKSKSPRKMAPSVRLQIGTHKNV